MPKFEVLRGLTKQQVAIFIAIEGAGQRGLSMEQIIDMIYPLQAPTYAAIGIRVQLSKMKAPLARHGLRIATNAYKNRIVQKWPPAPGTKPGAA